MVRALNNKLKQIGLKPLKADPCIYISKNKQNTTILAIYVADILIATNNMGQMKRWNDRIKENLKRIFKMKDMGLVHYCLGIEFKQDLEKGTITMSQKKDT